MLVHYGGEGASIAPLRCVQVDARGHPEVLTEVRFAGVGHAKAAKEPPGPGGIATAQRARLAMTGEHRLRCASSENGKA